MNETQSQRVVIASESAFWEPRSPSILAGTGCKVTILSRNRPRPGGPEWQHVVWDTRSVGAWITCLDGRFRTLCNLAGRTMGLHEDTESTATKFSILESEATRVLGRCLPEPVPSPPPDLGTNECRDIYGDPPDLWCDEESPAGYGLARR